MRIIRRGNDINITWEITRYNQPEDFTGKNVVVKLLDKNNHPQKFEYTIDGNVITGIFYGKDQCTTGLYRLLLVENCGEQEMVTLDSLNAFLLTEKLDNQTSNSPDHSNINTEVQELSSDINVGADLSDYATKEYVDDAIALTDSSIQEELSGKQDTLVSGVTIKTINNESLLGEGNIVIQGGVTNVQSDWDEEDPTDPAYIQNKPDLSIYALDSSIPTKVSDLTNDSGFVTDASVQAELGSYVTDSSLQAELNGYATTEDLSSKQDTLVSGVTIKTINNESLLGEGNIVIQGGGGTQIQSDWGQTDNTAVDYIKNKPDLSIYALDSSIPTKTSDLVNDSSYITEAELESELNNYVTFSDIPVNVSTFVNDASYITPTALAGMFVYDASTNTLTLTIQ